MSCPARPKRPTTAGNFLAEDPDHPGSLGIAESEVQEAQARLGGQFRQGAGSLLGPVLTHQTVIGLEALKQFEQAGEYPDVVIACNGAGSNFSGLAFPFLHQNWRAGRNTRLVSVEPTACPSLTRGTYIFDYFGADNKCPIVKMHTLGGSFIPPSIHAGGLRYHGMARHISALYEHGDIVAIAVPQLATFEAAIRFTRSEGILPAPESAHATGDFNLSGHGHYDLAAYDAFLKNELEDYEYPDEAVEESLAGIPELALG